MRLSRARLREEPKDILEVISSLDFLNSFLKEARACTQFLSTVCCGVF